ncbi:hypothetical protein Ancab_008706 [Ancistrocladus abbreviatus]
MTQFSGFVLAGCSYMEVLKSQIPAVEDELRKGQEGSDHNDTEALQDARTVSSSAESVREGHVFPSGKRPAKEIKGVQTEIMMRREEELSAARFAHSARKKSLGFEHNSDFCLGNSNDAGPSFVRPTKELVSTDPSLCTPWAVDPVSLGCSPDISECSRPLMWVPHKA